MSMNAKIRRIPAADVDRLRGDENYLLAVTDMGRLDGQLPWLLRLLLRLTGTAVPQLEPESKPPVGTARPRGEILLLGKSWHGLHYLLARDPWDGAAPFKHAVFGETEIGGDLAGYGPAKLNEPAQVRQIAEALTVLSDAEIWRQYDGQRMEELKIYPGGWASDRVWKGELTRNFGRLREFYRRAEAAGDATISWLE